MQEPNNENTVPYRPQSQSEQTAPVNVSANRDSAAPTPGIEATQPAPAPKPGKKRRWPFILLGLFLIVLFGAVGTWLGYGAAVQLRQARMSEQRVNVATEHFMLGLVAQQTQQYEIARQQFEHVIRVDPNFPGAQDKLREVMIEMAMVMTPTPQPTEVTPTAVPTPDLRPPDDIYAQAQQHFINKEWDMLFSTIDSIRKADPKYQAVKLDGMLYVAFRFRGIEKIIHQANLEGGLYDLAMAERFAPLDVDALGYRNWSRMYLNGASFWELDWVRVMDYFEQIYPYFPNMRDSSGLTAVERYRLAARGQGDQLVSEEKYCEALEYYDKSLQAVPDTDVEQRKAEAYNLCYPPTSTPEPEVFTPTPTPTVEVTPTIPEGGETPPPSGEETPPPADGEETPPPVDG
jgi:tetratricopeptide (TPR) repeat protein